MVLGLSVIAKSAHAGVSPTLLVVCSMIALLVIFGNDNPGMRVPYPEAPSSSIKTAAPTLRVRSRHA